MEAPQNIEMAKRGETPFDLEVESKAAVAEVMQKKMDLLTPPDMLEMEPYYVNDLVSCDPHKLFCEMDAKNACMVNDEYDINAVLSGKYFTEGCHLAAPNQEGMHSAGVVNADGKRRDQSTVPVEDLRPIGGCGCCINALYCAFPACIGTTGRGKMLCGMAKFSCCKCLPNPGADEDRRCCAICEMQSYYMIPQTCVEGQCQCCCVDNRCAFPCTKNVPFIVNCLGFNCCADWKCATGCCKNVGELIPRLKPGN